ncbi:MAG TPA: hypothetical protein PKW82_06285 [Spirochaetales bacterium]|nr:hypothetical protein [Spirochaetales bacterium]
MKSGSARAAPGPGGRLRQASSGIATVLAYAAALMAYGFAACFLAGMAGWAGRLP